MHDTDIDTNMTGIDNGEELGCALLVHHDPEQEREHKKPRTEHGTLDVCAQTRHLDRCPRPRRLHVVHVSLHPLLDSPAVFVAVAVAVAVVVEVPVVPVLVVPAAVAVCVADSV